MDKKNNRRKKGGSYTALHILQHLCVVAAAVIAFYVFATSNVELTDGRGDKTTFEVSGGSESGKYEDSTLFNSILGKDLTDVICYGAIRNQMETNGRYDGSKEIDVTAFVNRYNGIPSEYITATYKLEDLIKWAQNGFDYSELYMSGQEADNFLSRMRTVTTVDLSSTNYSSSNVSYLNSDITSKTTVQDVSGNVLGQDGEVSLRDDVNATILTNRYLTVDGKKIENYVSSWDEYYALCSNVKTAAEDLLTNYNLYLGYQEYFDSNNTNLAYCIRTSIGKDTTIYSNINPGSNSIQSIDQLFQNEYGKYIRYNPADIEAYDTNTQIAEDTIRYVTKGYSYAYPENTQVWIGVDTSYSHNDNLAKGRHSYLEFEPYSIQLWTAVIILLLLYLLLGVFLTVKEGVAYDHNGERTIRLHQQDEYPTELMILSGAVIIAGILYLIRLLGTLNLMSADYKELMLIVVGLFVFVVSLLFSFYYYSLVRRIKAGNLWKHSLINYLCKWIGKSAVYAFDHSGTLLRVWIPVAALVIVNVLGTVLCFNAGSLGVLGILLILCVDGVTGYLCYKAANDRQIVLDGINRIKEGDVSHKINEATLHGDNLVLAQAVNNIGDGIESAVSTSMKDERMKADLITNVSHDIKTPLTSIINYVDLIKRENVENPKVREYIKVLDEKSQKLKQLTDDLVEASKISSGNILLQWEKINLVELVNQTIGEFSEKFEQKRLVPVLNAKDNDLYVEADSRRIWRVIENLFNNICKYALEGTRVYIDLQKLTQDKDDCTQVVLSIKNISANPLNVNPEELTERFIRGDESRTTEGSGLGLSIAKSLTEAQNGTFEIQLDGDLFKVILTFPLLKK